MVHVPRSITPRFTTARLPVVTEDGFELAAQLYSPVSGARATVLIHGATATPQTYYRRFAEFLAGAGYRVVTYDYRGIGESRPESLRDFDATMTDWALLDASAVIDHVERSYRASPRLAERSEASRAGRSTPVIAIGHSFGGQLVGLLDRAGRVDAQVMVASQLGSYHHWPALSRLKLFGIWRGLVPITTSLFGYWPGRVGLGVDLPAGVAREWARWCSSPGYLTDHVPDAVERFARFTAPTLLYSFTDDEFAPERAVTALVELLRNTRLHHRRLAPADVGRDRIDHFGFFREELKETLWRELVEQLDRVVDGHGYNVGSTGTAGDWVIDAAALRAELEFGRV